MQNFSCSALLRCHLDPHAGFRLRAFHLLRGIFPDSSPNLVRHLYWWSYNPDRCRNTVGLGSCAFARHYLRNHFCFLFLRVMRCFSSPGSPTASQCTGIASGGLPHSEIRGSGDICSSPRLFAACHVLLRLREPRHPSCALLSFPLTVFEFLLPYHHDLHHGILSLSWFELFGSLCDFVSFARFFFSSVTG